MSKLAFPDLELVYDKLAEAIDSSGSDREVRFLAKLALMLANELGDRHVVERCVYDCLLEIEEQAMGTEQKV